MIFIKYIAIIINYYLIVKEECYTIVFKNSLLIIIGNKILLLPLLIILISVTLFRNASFFLLISNIATVYTF
jgi:hypothetical protein